MSSQDERWSIKALIQALEKRPAYEHAYMIAGHVSDCNAVSNMQLFNSRFAARPLETI